MANLPTSLNIQQPNISDGSDLLRMAAMLSKEASDTADKAFTDFKSTLRTSANNDLASTFAKGIASGLSPDEAFKQASGTINSWTSADAINAALQTRNAEKEAIIRDNMDRRAEAAENRLQLDWEGKNEASEANLLLDTGYNTNNSKLYNQGLSKASDLSDIAKKFVTMKNLAEQQDKFASSAVSRAYNKALTDQIADKKLAAQLDARFRVLESQNPTATKAQIAQAVAQDYKLSPDRVNQVLNEYGYASGQSLLNESYNYLSKVLPSETVETYNKAQETQQNLKVDIQQAIKGNTDQNKKDTNTAIDILSKDLSSVLDEEGDSELRASLALAGMPATTKLNEKEAKEIVSSLLKNPSKKNFESIKNRLEAKGYHGHFVDWLNSNFIINKSNTVELSPNSATNINNALNQELVGDRTRGDILAESQVDSERAMLGFNNAAQGVDYSKLLALTRQNNLKPEQQQELAQLASALINRGITIDKQRGKVANATLTQNPKEQINQTINTFSDIIESGKIITPKQLVDKGLTESQANAVIERIRDVAEEAKDSGEYKNIPLNVIQYAVLNNFLDADSYTVSDKSYLKSAMNILDKILSKKGQSKLEALAQEISNADAIKQATKQLDGGK